MNRQERRKANSILRKEGDKTAVTQARRDGRPQYYDILPGDRTQCALCLAGDNKNTNQYGRGEAFMADPGNSPFDDGGVYTVCMYHLPEDAVIHDPVENETRTKDGQNIWTEPDATEGVMPPTFKEPSNG